MNDVATALCLHRLLQGLPCFFGTMACASKRIILNMVFHMHEYIEQYRTALSSINPLPHAWAHPLSAAV